MVAKRLTCSTTSFNTAKVYINMFLLLNRLSRMKSGGRDGPFKNKHFGVN